MKEMRFAEKHQYRALISLGVLTEYTEQQNLSAKQYALKVTHYLLLLENKVPLASYE